ncbi:unnamed protein product [Calypogeia fissa]
MAGKELRSRYIPILQLESTNGNVTMSPSENRFARRAHLHTDACTIQNESVQLAEIEVVIISTDIEVDNHIEAGDRLDNLQQQLCDLTSQAQRSFQSLRKFIEKKKTNRLTHIQFTLEILDCLDLFILSTVTGVYRSP